MFRNLTFQAHRNRLWPESFESFHWHCLHVCFLVVKMSQSWRWTAPISLFYFLFICISNAQQEVLSENPKRSNESLLWGPYRPNLYFGVRPRIPKSLTTGLLWARTDSFETVQHSTLRLPLPISPRRWACSIGLPDSNHRFSAHM